MQVFLYSLVLVIRWFPVGLCPEDRDCLQVVYIFEVVPELHPSLEVKERLYNRLYCWVIWCGYELQAFVQNCPLCVCKWYIT